MYLYGMIDDFLVRFHYSDVEYDIERAFKRFWCLTLN